VKKPCFSEVINHGDGKYTLFGRVLADMPEDPSRQNMRSADIVIPPGLNIDHFVVSATFVTEDPDDPHRGKPFFPCTSGRNPDAHAITVVATRRRDDANPSRYVCEYIVMATKKI
jgi:hypothetical protein